MPSGIKQRVYAAGSYLRRASYLVKTHKSHFFLVAMFQTHAITTSKSDASFDVVYCTIGSRTLLAEVAPW